MVFLCLKLLTVFLSKTVLFVFITCSLISLYPFFSFSGLYIENPLGLPLLSMLPVRQYNFLFCTNFYKVLNSLFTKKTDLSVDSRFFETF